MFMCAEPMADPISWMTIAAAAASTASQAVQGIQGYQQGMYEAAVADQNAKIAEGNAARARLDAARAEEAQRTEARQSLGRSAAAYAQGGAAGGGLGAGSGFRVIDQGAKAAELDALNIRYGGETEAFADLTQAAQFKAERSAAKKRARGALMSGLLGSAASALSGAADYRGARAQQRYGRPSPAQRPAKVGTSAPTNRPNRPKIKVYGSGG